jgi:imidazoleglycerol phosphate dehydratase HisB
MLKPEEAGQILYSNLSIEQKDALLQTLLYEREAALDVAATLYTALMFNVMERSQHDTAKDVSAQIGQAITTASENKAVIKRSKEIAIKFIEQKLEALSAAFSAFE